MKKADPHDSAADELEILALPSHGSGKEPQWLCGSAKITFLLHTFLSFSNVNVISRQALTFYLLMQLFLVLQRRISLVVRKTKNGTSLRSTNKQIKEVYVSDI